MSKMKHHMFETNHPLTKVRVAGDGSGLKRKAPEMNKGQQLAEIRWAKETINDACKVVRAKQKRAAERRAALDNVPTTTDIPANGVSQLIQIDSALYVDKMEELVGRSGEERVELTEIIADYNPLVWEHRLQEHMDNEENYMDKAKWNVEDNVKRTVAYYNKTVDDGGEHNTAAIEAEEERKVYFSKRATERWFESRRKDIHKQLMKSYDRSKEMTDDLDNRLANKYEETNLEAFEWISDEALEMDRVMREIGEMKIPELIMVGEGDQLHRENVALFNWAVSHDYVSLMCSQYKKMDFRLRCAWKKLERKINRDFRGKEQPVKFYRETVRNMWVADNEAFSDDKRAEAKFSINPDCKEFNEKANTKWNFYWHIMNEAEKLFEKKMEKKAKAEAEFMERQDCVELEVVKGEEYWFEDGKGGYLEGSCTDVSFRPVNPNLVEGETGAYWDVCNHSDNTRGHYAVSEDELIEAIDLS